jgi:hypothetical protein
MAKAKVQAVIISRIHNAIPNLKFVAFYNAAEDCVNACMHGYSNRSFVYLLTVDFEGTECCIYVGKSKSQYSRFISHIKKYEFDHIYLFECASDELNKSEALVIKELKPLYNRQHNPHVKRYNEILSIDYSSAQTFEIIQSNLTLKKQYENSGLFGFSLNPAIYAVLEKEAEANQCNCSDMLQFIFEKLYHEQIAEELKLNKEYPNTNLYTTFEYANKHGCSCEQVKQFLREKNRICGAMHIGRDWVLPKDAYFPTDRRKKCP